MRSTSKPAFDCNDWSTQKVLTLYTLQIILHLEFEIFIFLSQKQGELMYIITYDVLFGQVLLTSFRCYKFFTCWGKGTHQTFHWFL